MRKITALALTTLVSAGMMSATAAPAQADTKACVALSKVPKQVIAMKNKVYVKGEGISICIGWGSGSTYRTTTILEQNLGTINKPIWTRAPLASSHTGPKSAGYYTINVHGRQIYRTYTKVEVLNSSGVIIKKADDDHSPHVYF